MPQYQQGKHSRRGIASALALALCPAWGGGALAQTAPDAGSVLRQIEKQRILPLPPRAPEPAPPPPLQPQAGTVVTLSGVRFAGNTRMTAEQLVPAVANYLNRPVTFGELQSAAVAVAGAYREAGWVVRAYLPQQEIGNDGVFTIQVVEARFGAVRVEGSSRRIARTSLAGIVENAQPPDSVVNGEAFDRALLLINDLPGISVSGRLGEGQSHAETDLVLTVSDTPFMTGELTLDNTGQRTTGPERALGHLVLNSPDGLGGRLDGLLLHTRGNQYLRGAYSLPIMPSGWRVSLNLSHLSYRVVAPEFAPADLKGSSTGSGLEASSPLLRRQRKNLYFAMTLDKQRFDNRSHADISSRYASSSASVSLNGNRFDDLGGGGASTASLTFVQGNIDLRGSPNEADDARTTGTAGTFRKLRVSATRQQVLTRDIALLASFAGQWASKNLDSSEKFYLGGANGVRAYPASEGGGSSGQLMVLEARIHLPGKLKLAGFYDYGSVQVNKDNSFTGAAERNRYALHGAGVSLAWTGPWNLRLQATLARRIGHNPNPAAAGTDQDGTLKKTRAWLVLSLPV